MRLVRNGDSAVTGVSNAGIAKRRLVLIKKLFRREIASIEGKHKKREQEGISPLDRTKRDGNDEDACGHHVQCVQALKLGFPNEVREPANSPRRGRGAPLQRQWPRSNLLMFTICTMLCNSGWAMTLLTQGEVDLVIDRSIDPLEKLRGVAGGERKKRARSLNHLGSTCRFISLCIPSTL